MEVSSELQHQHQVPSQKLNPGHVRGETNAAKYLTPLPLCGQVQSVGALLLIEFSTLSDYLFLLRTVAEALGPHGPTIMFYLAAAVSDFYIPDENMVRFQSIVFSKFSLVPSHHGFVILFNTHFLPTFSTEEGTGMGCRKDNAANFLMIISKTFANCQ